MGARLQRFWEAWESRSVDPWVVSVLRDGYRIPFRNQVLPPRSPLPREFPSYLGSREKFLALQQEVQEMLEKGAIERIVEPDPGSTTVFFWSPRREAHGAQSWMYPD